MQYSSMSPQELLANFQNVFISTATIQAAKQEADRSENELMQHLNTVTSGIYLQPGNLTSEKDSVTKASLDAHIKKVQAQQLNELNDKQLQDLQTLSQAAFMGRKLQVTVRSMQQKPVESMFFDTKYGNRSSIAKKRRYSGVVENIMLDKNVLVLRPTVMSKMLNSSLQYYIVYIIDPDTLQPMIDISMN